MAHIALPEGIPGIAAGLAFSPETAGPLGALAEVLLRSENSLTRGEREMIATYVSKRNDCYFCHTSHRAIAAHQLEGSYNLVDSVCNDLLTAPVSDKMKALLVIAGHVQESGRKVTSDDVAKAKSAGTTDKEIHDTVLIAAAFCMFNRYVDGLGCMTPTDQNFYDQVGGAIAQNGYRNVLLRSESTTAT